MSQAIPSHSVLYVLSLAYLVFYVCVLQPVMLLRLPVACRIAWSVYTLLCYLTCLQPISLLSPSIQPCMLRCLSKACRATQHVYSQSCYLAQLVILLSLSVVCLVPQPVYSLSCYIACWQLVMLLSISMACNFTQPSLSYYLACHATQPTGVAYNATQYVYSLSGYLACLQPVMLLSMSIICHATQPAILFSLSLAFHVTQPINFLSSYLVCLCHITYNLHIIKPFILISSMNTYLFYLSIQLAMPKQFPKPHIALYARLLCVSNIRLILFNRMHSIKFVVLQKLVHTKSKSLQQLSKTKNTQT